jgi:hypothetical protein
MPPDLPINGKKFESVYLHIGTEKTGTKSIQSLLSSNRETLSRSGFLYPTSPGHLNHICLAILAGAPEHTSDLALEFGLVDGEARSRYSEAFQQEFAKEISGCNATTLILSNEHLSSRLRSKDEIARIRELLFNYSENVKIVVYLRPQDDILLSSYSTSVKSGSVDKFGLPHGAARDYMDYDKILNPWSEVLGAQNVLVRIFQKSRLMQGDVLADFCSTLGIQLSKLSVPDKKNKSLDGKSLLFLREFNKHVPRYKNDGVNPLRGKIAEVLEAHYCGPPLKVDKEALSEFRASFDDGNKAVADKFLPNHSGPLFDPSEENREDGVTELTAADAVEIAAALWCVAGRNGC